MEPMLVCEGIAFSYNGVDALRDMSFTVQTGEVLALLGPNGAGKTTTIRVLNGLLKAKKGTCRVLGYDPRSQGELIRRRTGVLTETPALYERLTAWQNLKFFGTLAGLSAAQIDQCGGCYLDMFDLYTRADDRVETYSKGMKQRLALARALLHDPQLLFLDEPASGLDPAAAKQVEMLIYDISKQENRAVVLCTHRLYEAERVCDRVAVMKKGRILDCGTLDDLRDRYAPQTEIQFSFAEKPDEDVVKSLQAIPGIVDLTLVAPLALKVKAVSEKNIPAVVQHLASGGVLIQSVIPCKADLETIYLSLQEMHEEEQE